jgi:hypothetical protein
MAKIYNIESETDSHSVESMIEKAFKEGCEHGYKKAMREAGFDERMHRGSYREGFEEKIAKLKEKYK